MFSFIKKFVFFGISVDVKPLEIRIYFMDLSRVCLPHIWNDNQN